MSEPTGWRCCLPCDTYCNRGDLLVGLPGLHVVEVANIGDGLTVTVESPSRLEDCRSCGVLAGSHGRSTVGLVDAPWGIDADGANDGADTNESPMVAAN